MPKPFGMSARGRMTRYLRQRYEEREHLRTVTAAQLAAKFKTTPGNVRSLLRKLESHGWQVHIADSMRGNEHHYIILPPEGRAA